MNTKLGLTILRIVLGLVICFYSAVLVLHQLNGQMHMPLLVLGGAELVAAILLLIPATLRLGGIALIVIFVLAGAFHILHGEYDVAYLAVYAAAAYAVLSQKKHA